MVNLPHIILTDEEQYQEALNTVRRATDQRHLAEKVLQEAMIREDTANKQLEKLERSFIRSGN